MERLRKELEYPRYELIPTGGAEEQLERLPAGATVTVTCSPSKGPGPTLDLAEEISARGYRVIPHLSARMVESEEHLDEMLGRLEEAGIRGAFVVGGDATEALGPYGRSLELLVAIRRRDGGIELGITGYAEGHPLIDEETLMADLLEKQPYADYVVSQLCFDAGAVLRWVEAIRERGVRLPVVVGIPGAMDKKKLLEVSLKIGVGDSVKFLRKNVGAITGLLRPGGYTPKEVVEELAPYLGDPHYDLGGFHVYTFNHVEGTEKWRTRMLEEEKMPTGEIHGTNR